ncbi:hypothetical protein [Streptomyces sp. SA15]|uniref:hypothetical protein n=1 Tax=Streptomyces sp. SA15 TaxID=934019 RepID=UPI00117F84B8|nr:hypothetical protein [Streptomyces sp. SA15]
MNVRHIGEYNGIYFLEGTGGIVGVCDRAHRKDAVGFAEDGLIDLASPPRPTSKVIFGGAMPREDGAAPHHMYMPDGFGRRLYYEPLERDDPGVLAVRLTIGLPERALYRVRWETVSRDDDTFMLDNGISVTVSTSLPWAYQDSVLQTQTGDQPGEIVFVVESREPPSRVRDIVIVACEGHEREAIMVRSRCGPGFVPCFVIPAQQWSDRVATPVEVLVGPGAPDFDPLPADAPTLTAPDTEAAYGPALALAVAHGARLVLTGQDSVIRLTGEVSREWELSEVLNSPLTVFGTGREVVVGESTPVDLLVCQAVGYASLQRCQIAFIPPVSGDTGTSMVALARECAGAVPPELRELHAEVLTVFTRRLPLHLTPLPDGRRWMDQHMIAHLPGQIASVLLSRPLEPAPRLLFGVVFDALHAFTATEGHVYQDKLADGLSYPLLLSRKDARREVLQEVLHRVDVDLLMIIAHGEDDHFEDARNDQIPDSLIRTWQLRGGPVVFNNSCSSWTSTGEAFLAAGARAVIGTLWPVTNDVAARTGSSVGERSHDENVLSLLHHAMRTVADPEAAAYVYVGLPDTRFLARASIDEEETLAVLNEAMDMLYRCLNELAEEGKLDVAMALHNALVPALRERFGALVRPGELPLHLPPPKAQASVLDIDYVLANASLRFLQHVLPMVAPQRTPAVLDRIRHFMRTAHHELTTWDERHRVHMGRDEANRSEASGILLAALFTGERALPAAALFADLGDTDEARYWMDVAIQLIGPPGDDTVIQRIRDGIREEYVAAWSPDGNTGRRSTIDWLAQAVDKSVLAYRFGEARDKLGDTSQAIAFYEAAIDLTEAGSAVETQARARLRMLRTTEDGILSEHVTAFTKACRSDNLHASSTAAADMLRYAADNRRPLSDGMVRQALEIDSQPERSHHWVSHRLSVLGAAMTYFASQKDSAGIGAVIDEVFGYVGAYESTAVVPLNELAAWYYQNGDYAAAIDIGLDLGTRLRDARCFDSAARMLCFTARVILRAYQARPELGLLGQFFEVSEMIGRILSEHVDVRATIGDRMSDVFAETQSIWRQIADKQDRRLALRGYSAYTRWPAARKTPEWELLSKAHHPRNVEAIQGLAASGSLTREAHVRITTDFTVTMTTTTHRQDHTGPDTVYGLCPLYSGATELRGPSATFVAGTAVFPLRPQESVTVKQIGVPALNIVNGWATYHERWGSRTVSHRLRIDLAPGLIPAGLRCQRRGGEPAEATIRFDEAGCHIDVRGAFPEEPWLADITMSFNNSPELGRAISTPSLPFTQETPIELYTLLMSRPPR